MAEEEQEKKIAPIDTIETIEAIEAIGDYRKSSPSMMATLVMDCSREKTASP